MGQRHGARWGVFPFGKLWKLRKWLPGVLAAAAGLAGTADYARAQPATMNPSTMPTPAMPGMVVPVAPTTPGTPVASAEKTVAVYFDKAGWDDVLDWYAKETGLTLITVVKPTGSLTLKPAKDKKFTMAEVTDLINEALTQQKFILIRRNMTFFIHPADDKVPADLLPRLTLDELAKRGKTEIVQVIIPIKGMQVEDAQEELKRLLTPFGQMVGLVKPNSILLVDTVGNIIRIKELLKEIEDRDIGSDSSATCASGAGPPRSPRSSSGSSPTRTRPRK